MSDHAHHALHTEELPTRRLRWVLFLTIGYLIVELIGGVLSNSLALLSDAGHMFSDVSALTLVLVAMHQMRRPPDARRSFGYRRLEIVSALANGILLCGVAIVIAYEGIDRFRHPPEIRSDLMLAVAALGLVVNLIGIALLHSGSRTSLGIRGAFLHVVGDALGSVGAVAAAIVIGMTGWTKIDALISILIAILIVLSGRHLIKESLHVLLEGVPRHINLPDLEAALLDVGGVDEIHDLHVWRIGSGFDTLSVHLVLSGDASSRAVKETVRAMMCERYGITHCTIETEKPGEHTEETHPGTICERNDR